MLLMALMTQFFRGSLCWGPSNLRELKWELRGSWVILRKLGPGLNPEPDSKVGPVYLQSQLAALHRFLCALICC